MRPKPPTSLPTATVKKPPSMSLPTLLSQHIVRRPQRIALLQHIAEQGSITRAAKSAGLSYKAAWDAIDELNNLAQKPLVERAIGGKGGGDEPPGPTPGPWGSEPRGGKPAGGATNVSSLEDFLQLLERLGNRWLADRQGIGRLGEAALASDFEKAQQVAEFDTGVDVHRGHRRDMLRSCRKARHAPSPIPRPVPRVRRNKKSRHQGRLLIGVVGDPVLLQGTGARVALFGIRYGCTLQLEVEVHFSEAIALKATVACSGFTLDEAPDKGRAVVLARMSSKK